MLDRQIEGAGGVLLAASVFGPATGMPMRPKVLLLHGGGQTRYAWGQLPDRLCTAGHEVWAVDLRGHGDSEWAVDGDYSLRAMVADVQRIVDEIGADRVAIVGASVGGLTAMSYASLASRRVEHLVMVDVVPDPAEVGEREIVDFMTAYPTGFRTVEDAAHAVADYLPHRSRPSSVAGLRKNLRHDHTTGRLRWHWDPAFLPGGRPWTSHCRTELQVAANRLKTPCTLIVGTESRVVDEAGIEAFRTRAPFIQVLRVEGAGHMVAGDRNDPFSDLVVSALASDGVDANSVVGRNWPDGYDTL